MTLHQLNITNRDIRNYWLRGLAKTMIQGGATAVSTWLGLAGANSIGLEVPVLDLKGIGVVFASQAIFKAFEYLKLHPLPDLEDIPEAEEQKP